MKYLLSIFLIFIILNLRSQNLNINDSIIKKDFTEWLIKASKLEKESIINLDSSKYYVIVFSSIVPYSSYYFQQVEFIEETNDSLTNISEFSNYKNINKRNDTIFTNDFQSLQSGFFYESLTSFGDKYFVSRGSQIHYHGGQISYGTTFTYYIEKSKLY